MQTIQPVDSSTVHLDELEAAINRCRHECLTDNQILPPNLRMLAEVYGTMLYERAHSMDLRRFSPDVQTTVRTWLEKTASTISQP
jgi:hypothetical protein